MPNTLSLRETQPRSWMNVLHSVTNLRQDLKDFLARQELGSPRESVRGLFKIILSLEDEALDKTRAGKAIRKLLQDFAKIRVLDTELACLDDSFAELEELV